MSSVSYIETRRPAGEIPAMSGGLSKRLREALEMRGITQAELGRACGVTREAVSAWVAKHNPTAPTLDKIEPITELLDIDPVWLLRGKHAGGKKGSELIPATIPVPEYDVRVSAGGGFVITEETKRDVWLFSRHYLADELRLPASRLVVVEIIGDSMEPTLKSGDRVLVNMGDTRVSQPGIFLLWDGDGTVVKRLELVPGAKPQVLKRISDNPLHGSYEVRAAETRIIGRVVWIARRA